MQLLGASDLTLDTTASPRSHFDYYVSSYILQAPTEGVGAEVKAPMLKRCVDIRLFLQKVACMV